VVLLCIADAKPFAEAANLPFLPYGENRFPVGYMPQRLETQSRLQGQEGLEYSIESLALSLRGMFDYLPEEIINNGVDALVLDSIDVGSGLIPMHLGLPYTHICNALHLDFTGQTPFCVLDWPPDRSPEGIARNLVGLKEFMKTMTPITAIAMEYAQRWGLRIDWTDPFATISPLAWITQTPKQFDFEGTPWPPQFHYAGPFNDGVGRLEAHFPWDRLTGEPLIYASMGTLQNGLESVFNTIAEAVGERTGYQLVLSIGTNLDPGQITSLPSNSIVVQSAPQLDLLARSALCITHAGLNTTLEALTYGVPMVAIPITNDQPGVAARIAHSGTGRFVPIKQLSVETLKELIDTVLGDQQFRKNADSMRNAIEEAKGLEQTVAIIERAFRL
jgi:MGT family glycosyltransferase